MDEFLLADQMKRDSCFVSTDFAADMSRPSQHRQRYVLPDYRHVTRGFVKEEAAAATGAAATGGAGEEQTIVIDRERFAVPDVLFNPSGDVT